MVNYRIKSRNKSVGMAIITAFFLIVGIALIVIGFQSEIVSWLKEFGIALCVLCVPIAVYLVYVLIIKRIKDM